MNDNLKSFGGIAKGLAHNPLGIIALFIVLVYGFAFLVVIFSNSLTLAERVPLIYFLNLFPILVLGVFSWLVSAHSTKLFAPSDFKDEENYVKMQLSAVASLAVATKKDQPTSSREEIASIVETVQHTMHLKQRVRTDRRNCVLWVDDNPSNNVYERQALEAVGVDFTLALSTQEALGKLAKSQFAAIISDMGRREGPREGYLLLDTLRKGGDQTPFFSMLDQTRPSTNVKQLNMAAKAAPTILENSLRC